MSVEATNTISGFNLAWPLQSDGLIEGDDHLRLIKSVLQTQFPGVSGNGYSAVINATEAEVNHLVGVTGSIQDQLDAITGNDNLIAPAGTVLPFYQASPPVGWTQVLTENDKMLRVVSGTGGGAGGADSPISFSTAHNHTTGDHALSVPEMPAHTHTISLQRQNVSGNSGSTVMDESGDSNIVRTTNATGGGAVHNHGNTGDKTLTFSPKYINIIIARKD